MPATRLLETDEISARQGNRLVLDRLSLAIDSGAVVTLIGPNGAGKTTAIRTIMGLLPLSGGTVSRRPGLRLGYMPQTLDIDTALPLTVRGFVKMWAGVRATDADAALDALGIAHLAANQVQGLSGGEWRRVLLARAFAMRPDLLVLDEPLTGIDVAAQSEIYRLLDAKRRSDGVGILMVSHDLHIVMARTDQVICLDTRVQCRGTPQQIADDPGFARLFGVDAAAFAVYRHTAHDHDGAHDHD